MLLGLSQGMLQVGIWRGWMYRFLRRDSIGARIDTGALEEPLFRILRGSQESVRRVRVCRLKLSARLFSCEHFRYRILWCF